MLMKPIAKLIAGTAAALILATGGASATPTVLSFGFNGTGNYTVNTGNITAATATKTIPSCRVGQHDIDPSQRGDWPVSCSAAPTPTPLTFGSLPCPQIMAPPALPLRLAI